MLKDEERLVSAFRQALSAAGRGKRVRLAVLDLILSFPPVIMPVKRLCELFRCVRMWGHTVCAGGGKVNRYGAVQVCLWGCTESVLVVGKGLIGRDSAYRTAEGSVQESIEGEGGKARKEVQMDSQL